MAQLELKHAGFRYAGAAGPAVEGVDLAIESGEFVVLCGRSGSGKTTLLQMIKSELTSAGERSGGIYYEGRLLESYGAAERSREIGMVMQQPENQIVMDTVLSELSFGMENIGLPQTEMRKRLGELAQFFRLEPLLHKPTMELSGGQQQLLNLASILLLRPRLLLLDEPTAQLDPVAAREFVQVLRQLNEEFGLTILMTEHRLDDVWALADRVGVMDRGRLAAIGAPAELAASAGGHAADSYLPSMVRLFRAIGGTGPLPLTVKEARDRLAEYADRAERDRPPVPAASLTERWPLTAGKRAGQARSLPDSRAEPLLECRELHYQYAKNERSVLSDLSLTVRKGEVLAVLGANGSGKSTLLKLLCGLRRPQRGTVRYEGKDLHRIPEAERYRRIAYLTQNPKLFFRADTAREELRASLPGEAEALDRIAEAYGIGRLLDRHPYDLSGGEMQMLALACLAARKPELLLLDEPTKGLDPRWKDELAERLGQWRAEGGTVVLVSHDVEFCARHATRCALMFAGSLATEADPAAFFQDNVFYTTPVNRIVRDRWPEVLTWEEAAERCGASFE